MLKLDVTSEVVFGFDGPNICLLGNEEDFQALSKAIIDLTGKSGVTINLLELDFVENVGDSKYVFFSSRVKANLLGVFDDKKNIVFELDPSYWNILFKYFVLMSWEKRTYYLNDYENGLNELGLKQECNFICSSEF